LIKELRALTQAGMKDCKDAIAEADGDLQKAVDIIKAKGLNIASGREGKTASEGRVLIMEGTNFYDKDGKSLPDKELKIMIEVNCQTDFVANSPDFISFVESAGATLNFHAFNNEHFTADIMEN